jgi:integrase/recombinase XerD
MSQQPISELRRRMLEDMAVRKFSEATQRNYIRHIAEFAKFLGRSPDSATADDVRRFQVHMTESGAHPPKLNSATSALRFFFGTTLDRVELARHLARVHYPRPLPRVLSPEEVGRLLEAAPGPGLKYKAVLSVAYGAGLRAGEVVMLRVSDIDSKRMLIRVEQGKGLKDRHAMLLPESADQMRDTRANAQQGDAALAFENNYQEGGACGRRAPWKLL